jgi:hypothetical protein
MVRRCREETYGLPRAKAIAPITTRRPAESSHRPDRSSIVYPASHAGQCRRTARSCSDRRGSGRDSRRRVCERPGGHAARWQHGSDRIDRDLVRPARGTGSIAARARLQLQFRAFFTPLQVRPMYRVVDLKGSAPHSGRASRPRGWSRQQSGRRPPTKSCRFTGPRTESSHYKYCSIGASPTVT